jgi:hypothetical protein
MLSKQALNSALPLAVVLDQRDMYLTAAPGTPLEALVNATRADEHFQFESGGEFTPDIENIAYIANAKDPLFQGSPHDVVLDELATECIAAVQKHLAFAKTVVAPGVQSLVEKVAGAMNAQLPSTLLGLEVSVWSPPKPLTNTSLIGALRSYEETPYDSPAMKMNMPALSYAEIVEIMASGSKGLDGDVKDWLAVKGEAWLLDLWASMFQPKQIAVGDRRSYEFGDYLNHPTEGLDNAVAVFLLARKLHEKPIDGIAMNAQAFEALVVEFRNQAGGRLCRALEDLTDIAKRQQLVRSIKGKVCTVNDSVYRSWIAAGGDIEVLFGNMLDNAGHVTVDAINEKAAALKIRWQQHAALTATVEANRRYLRLKEFLSKYFREDLLAAVADDPVAQNSAPGMIMIFDELLEAVRDDEFADMYGLSLRLVCAARFAHTDAEFILTQIAAITKENPGVPVREAAAVATINYIARWVASQLKLHSLRTLAV